MRSLQLPLEVAILRTVAYADVFDYPLTTDEVCRYLVGVAAPLSAVREALDTELLARHRLVRCQGYVTLPGRKPVVETRLRREAVSARMWRKGVQYGLAIASLPFVRLVAVTGTLAVNNMEQGEDIDYLIVTVPHRVWLARLLALVFVHLGRLEGVTICPNYVLSSDALGQFAPSFFTAHELAQMIPLYGYNVYQELIRVNAWARRFLPNAFNAPQDTVPYRVTPLGRAFKRGAEFALQGKLGDAWEGRERRLKIARLGTQAAHCGTSGAVFTPECCKGHINDHGRRIQEAYARRLHQIGLEPESTPVLTV
jgi:hypothetical protein